MMNTKRTNAELIDSTFDMKHSSLIGVFCLHSAFVIRN